MTFMQWIRDPAARRGLVGGVWGAAALAVGLVACGGGGGDASGTAAPAASGGTASIAAYTQGTLTGFGSIIVNGVRFDESTATVTDDGGTAQPASALKLGMQVQVDSDKVANGLAKAHAVRFGSAVLGPVAAIDATAQTFVVVGQTVDVKADTVFDTTLSAGLSALSSGALVAVHGVPDAATGHLVATRVDSASGATAYKLRGTVASLDTTAKTFAIGAAVIDYAGLAAAEVPATLANGATVRVLLATATNAAGRWVATRIGDGPLPRPADKVQALVRGTISAFTSSAAFSVNGMAVDASAATFPDGTSGLAQGVAVEVSGAMSNGVLVATVVRIEAAHDGDDTHRPALHGLITALDATAKTFALRGVTVSYAGTVAYVNGTEADLAVGKSVSVTGTVGAPVAAAMGMGPGGGKGGDGRDHAVVQAATITFE